MGTADFELFAALKSETALAIPDTPPSIDPKALNPAKTGMAAGKKPPLIDGTFKTRGRDLICFPLTSLRAAIRAFLVCNFMSPLAECFIPLRAAFMIFRKLICFFFLFFFIPPPIFRFIFIAFVTNQADAFSEKFASLDLTRSQAMFSSILSASARLDCGVA
uniref:Uncharacterized protein n=1 Tax=Cacopsylla melanoneura TaxID=428564 RepID=A0A8D8VAY0_9HEMI